MGRREDLIHSEAERARAILAWGVVVYRWAALVWMVVLAATVEGGFERPTLAWIALGAAAAWTAWMTVVREPGPGALWFEIVLATSLVVVSGVVAPEGSVVTSRPFFATAWPLAAVLSWGVAGGFRMGVLSSFVLGAGLFASRVTNGIAPDELSGGDLGALSNGIVTFIIAGGAVGYVATLIRRASDDYQQLIAQVVQARERTARLQERASIARQIHDSVLQALALVNKRGRELAADGPVDPSEVAKLADMAGRQEIELRALIQREPEDAPTGTVSLRERLEATGRAIEGLPVTVTATGPMWVPATVGDEVAAAVKQALDNVVEHARASRANVFADADDGAVVITVRDDGVGFAFDPEALKAANKLGMVESMQGRVESLGGRMTVESGPSGTEVEFRVPVETEEP